MNNKIQKIYVAIGLSLVVLSIFGLIIYSIVVKPVSTVVIILFIITFFAGIWMAKKGVTDRYKFLRTNGYKIQAKVLYISLERIRIPIGGHTGPARPVEIFRLVCEGQDPISHADKIYKGSDMSLAPDTNVTSQSNLDVYIDRNNPDNYWVDISKVPVKTPRLGDNYQLQLQTGQNFYTSTDGINYLPE